MSVFEENQLEYAFTKDLGDVPKILGTSDTPPIRVANPLGNGAFVFGCEHAGNCIPEVLGTLGLSKAELNRHIAFDIGAEKLTGFLSMALDSPAIFQRYSRLVYDCNRAVDHPSAFVVDADGSHVAGNVDLSEVDKIAREHAIYRPFHEQATDLIERRRRNAEQFAYVAMHSFNETVQGQPRPWHIGMIYNQQPAMSKHLIQWFRDNTEYVVGDNEPYSPADAVDHTIRVQAEIRNIPYTMIEVRNDLLREETGIRHWAELIAQALRDFTSKNFKE